MLNTASDKTIAPCKTPMPPGVAGNNNENVEVTVTNKETIGSGLGTKASNARWIVAAEASQPNTDKVAAAIKGLPGCKTAKPSKR